MDILFESERAAEIYNSDKKLRKLHNVQRANLIRRRLDDLHAAPNLEAMRNLPGRTHELKADRAGQISIDLDGPYRLIFSPTHNPLPQKLDGGLDWTNITAITIGEVTNTHE